MALATRRTVGPAPAFSDRLGDVLDHELLVKLGWDPKTEVFTPDPAHRLFGWRVCPVTGCGGEGRQSDGLCTTCAIAWKGERRADFEGFCAQGVDPARRRPPGLCLVCRTPGHERPEVQKGLCISCNHVRQVRRQSVDAYVNGDARYLPAVPRPTLGRCPARTCQRLGAHLNGLCDAHYQLWRVSRFPPLEAFLANATPRHGDLCGRVVMTGLGSRIVNELLYGIQVSLGDGRKLRPPALRAAVKHLREAAVSSVADFDPSGLADPPRRFLVLTTSSIARLGADADSETAKDVWDLRVFGHSGRLSFVGGQVLHATRGEMARPVSQLWLKDGVKAWAADSLITKHPAAARRMVAAVGLLSEHLARRTDRGEVPEAIGRSDLESFLACLGRFQAAGTMSTDRRVRTVRSIVEFLRDVRAMGLCAPGAAMAGLKDEVALRRSDVPRAEGREPEDVGRALPQSVMAQLLDEESLALLEHLAGPTVRAAVELQAGVGRRTAELCALRFDCLDYDSHVGDDGQCRQSPVLVHDMAKVAKVDCRLPIHEREAQIISAQQVRVTAAFAHTDPKRLVLFPRATKNPDGTKPVAPAQLQVAVKRWVEALDRLDHLDERSGRAVPFPRERVVPYAFRHSFAQRHADAGTPVDTLKELLGHLRIQTTLSYFRVTTQRKRAAQEALGPLQLDAGGHRVRPGLGLLGDSEALRDQAGQVAVPFGVCTEPANVAADGRSCPFRHRCLGCEYFRTDPSYQPELTAYLAQLLAERERLALTPGLTDWARRDASPADEEIDAARRLVRANEEALACLDEPDRAQLDGAIATLRRDRARLATTFPVEFRGLVGQGRPQLFPTIERVARHQAHDA